LNNAPENNVANDNQTNAKDNKIQQLDAANAFVLWCMGMTTPMSAMPGCSCNPFSKDPKQAEAQKKQLESKWEIHDAEGVRSSINELMENQVSEFDELIPLLEYTSIDDIEEQLEALGLSEDAVPNVAKAIPGIVSRFNALGFPLPKKTMFAWDIVRAAFIALSSSIAGYISRDEAMYILGNMGIKANNCYSSWEEYAGSFLFALRIWTILDVGYDEKDEQINPSYRFIHMLLTGENGICKRIPFDFGVKEQEARNELVKKRQDPAELYKGSLDLYCGTLTRYYTKNWRNESQKNADLVGVKFAGEEETQANMPPQEKVTMAIMQWRNNLEDALKSNSKDKDKLPERLFDWNEDSDIDYMTLRPDWDGFGALKLWALHTEQNLPLIKKIPANKEVVHDDGGHYMERQTSWKWYEEEAYMKARKPGYKTKFPVLIQSISMFVPSKLLFAISGNSPIGNNIVISTVQALLMDLNRLNEMTWKATREEILSWKDTESCKNLKAIEVENGQVTFVDRTNGKEVDTMESLAKYGFSVFYAMAEYAIENNLPIMLDY